MTVKRTAGKLFFILGALLIAASVWISLGNFREDREGQENADYVLSRLLEEMPARENEFLPATADEATGKEDVAQIYEDPNKLPAYIRHPDMEMPTIIVDGKEYVGTIEIPSLKIDLPVMSECDPNALYFSPGRYCGTAYKGPFVIGGHNYVSHFAYLRNIREGDLVYFTDVDGNRFMYEVVGTEIIDENNAKDLRAGEWDLSLFTCTWAGDTRLTVRCLEFSKNS